MRRLLQCGLLVSSVFISGAVGAEAPGGGARSDVTGARAQPEYDPLGIRFASWTMSPEVRIIGGYDSNVFGLSRDARSDRFAIVAPSLGIRSNWDRHALDISASGTFTRYDRYDKQNTDEYAARADGRIDLGETALLPAVSITRIAERRGTNGTPLTFGEPSLYTTTDESLEARHIFGPLTASLFALHSDANYSTLTVPDAPSISQAFRDSNQWSGKVRLAYAPMSVMTYFVTAQYGHGRTPHPNPKKDEPSRSNDRLSALAGVAFDLHLLHVELEAGYLQQKFSNPQLADFSGLAYDGTIAWYPTTLLTITARSRKTLENSGIPEDGVIVARSSSLEIAYELLRNLVLRGSITDRHDRYRESRALTKSRGEEVRAEYQFNRTVAITAYQRYDCRDSSVTSVARHYCALLAGLSLAFRR